MQIKIQPPRVPCESAPALGFAGFQNGLFYIRITHRKFFHPIDDPVEFLMSIKNLFLRTSCVVIALTLSACSAANSDLDSAQFHEQIKEDRELTQTLQTTETIKLSLEEAIARGVEANMDAQVSALEYLSAQDDVSLEKIKAFPSVKYAITRNGRSNPGASSSMSAATGLQSLEPSISSEQYRTLRDLDINWNVLDVATALMQTKQANDRAIIAGERHRKVLQNIRSDVYTAYWRAQAADKTKAETRKLVDAANGHSAKLDQAVNEKLISIAQAEQLKSQILERVSNLETAQNEALLAEIELKSLLSLPQGARVELTSKPNDIAQSYKTVLARDTEELELAALESRPEMREAYVQQNVSARDTRMEILKTIPGAELFFGFKNDTNKFLEDNSWQTFSASLVQSVTELLTLPTRYESAKNREEVTKARRLATATAILAQVHIARHSLVYANRQYQNALSAEKSAARLSYSAQKNSLAGNMSGMEVVLARLEAQEKKIKALQAYSAIQQAYADLAMSTGADITGSFSVAQATRGGPG
jgi:multidrug efflux system outer membrane protein